MGEINRLLGEEGAGVRFDALGKTWTLSPLTKRRQAEFEVWLETRALTKADDIEARNPEAAAKYRDRVDAKIAANHYTFGGDTCRRALLEPSGVVEIVRLLLAPNHADADEDVIVAMMEQHPDALNGAVRQVVEMLKQSRLQKRPPTPPQAT